MCEDNNMINEPEKSNPPLASFKFIAWMMITISVGWFLVHYVAHLQMEFKSLGERLVSFL